MPPGLGPSVRQARHLYVCERWSLRRLADVCGIERRRLAALLRSVGVSIGARGAGRRRGSFVEPAGFASLLTELYVERRLPSTQIAAMLGLPESRIRARLRELGIRRRTTGPYNRQDRRDVDRELLDELAVREGLSARAISGMIGVSYQKVLRSARTFGLPVQLGGVLPRRGAGTIEIIDALYDDPQVRAALAAHDVPVVPAGGALWERFPIPVPLSAPLLEELYSGCGLAVSHIELLTGQPAQTIHRHLIQRGVPLRPSGYRSPFRRRWHAANVPSRTSRRRARHPGPGADGAAGG